MGKDFMIRAALAIALRCRRNACGQGVLCNMYLDFIFIWEWLDAGWQMSHACGTCLRISVSSL